MNKGDEHTDSGKSHFLDNAEVMRDRLNQISPSLCLAKWKQVSLHLTTGHTNSCYHPPLHKIQLSDIENGPSGLHNTAHKKQQRQLMLAGSRPSECQYCWNMEDMNKLSDRHYRSGEPWAAIDFDKIKDSTGLENDVVPSYVEVNFNNACNLKCSYCSPQFSSSWQDESNRLGGYPTSSPHNSPEYFVGDRKPIPVREHNPYVEAFWAWWPTLYPKLQHFRMTGGEPLMDKNTYKVFDYVLAMPKPDLHLNVTSNLSVEPALWNKYFDYVKQLCNTNIEHFMQYVSLDSGIPAHAEYIRHGMDFHRVKSRVNHFLFDIPNRNSLTFIITMNNLGVLGFQQQLEWILNLRKQHSHTYQRVWFDTPVLRQPAWQSLQILPESYVILLEKARDFMQANLETDANRFHGFKDYEVQRLERDIAWMRSGQSQDHTAAKADFYRFFNEHDHRRSTDFLKTFPEMSHWWEECKYYAQQS
jgi:organic radical activating enzyme